MLVKLLTEHGLAPTIVVWDAGLERAARRSTRRLQGAARRRARTCSRSSGRTLEPLVEAFGYRNLKVDGYEADDVIASLAEQAPRSRASRS